MSSACRQPDRDVCGPRCRSRPTICRNWVTRHPYTAALLDALPHPDRPEIPLKPIAGSLAAKFEADGWQFHRGAILRKIGVRKYTSLVRISVIASMRASSTHSLGGHDPRFART